MLVGLTSEKSLIGYIPAEHSIRARSVSFKFESFGIQFPDCFYRT